MIKSVFVSYILCFCLGYHLLAQHPEAKRANIWYFGNGAGLDFSSGSPVAITNGALITGEGSSSISDVNGNLLFYSDGLYVWDKTHNLMPNGIGLLGCSFGSSTQAVLIIPHPSDTNIYYLFTTDCDENFGLSGLNYSIVDLSLNNGLGDVFSKNNLLFSPTTEKLTASLCNNKIWVVGHKYNTNEFYAYKIDSSGIDTNPVISSVGSIHTEFWGGMKFSPNGKMLATTLNIIENKNELFEFDFNTGLLSNPISLDAFGGEYSLSFSNDNTKLYYTANGNLIYQYDVSSYIQSDINNSRILLISTMDNSDFFGIQLAIDSLLYVAGSSKDSLSAFLNPNSIGSSANFQKNQIFLNTRQSIAQLPNFIETYFSLNSFSCYTNIDTIPQNSNNTNTLDVVIPNIFTPNNDGLNDVFSIALSGYENIAWKIYNRWGETVKNGKLKVESDGNIELWDGRTNAGEKASDGTYYYIINLTKKGSELETKKGFIQILH